MKVWLILLIILVVLIVAFLAAVWVQRKRRAGGIIASRPDRNRRGAP